MGAYVASAWCKCEFVVLRCTCVGVSFMLRFVQCVAQSSCVQGCKAREASVALAQARGSTSTARRQSSFVQLAVVAERMLCICSLSSGLVGRVLRAKLYVLLILRYRLTCLAPMQWNPLPCCTRAARAGGAQGM